MSKRVGPYEVLSGPERAVIDKRRMERNLSFAALADLITQTRRVGKVDPSTLSRWLADKNGRWEESRDVQSLLLGEVLRALDLPPRQVTNLDELEARLVFAFRRLRRARPGNADPTVQAVERWADVAETIAAAEVELPGAKDMHEALEKTISSEGHPELSSDFEAKHVKKNRK